MNEIIILKQQPIIEYTAMKAEADKVTSKIAAMKLSELVVDETNYKDIKKLCTQLSKEFKGYEDARKAIKKAVNDPYTKFEGEYKPTIAKAYTDADETLKKAIIEVEDALRKKKEDELKIFFNEQRGDLDWLSFESAQIKANLSDSESMLQGMINNHINAVKRDIGIIQAQANSSRILSRFMNTLDLGEAIETVKREVEQEARLFTAQEALSNASANETAEVANNSQDSFVLDDIDFDDAIETKTFTVYGEDIYKVERFMKESGIIYE